MVLPSHVSQKKRDMGHPATICEQDIDYYPYGGQENDYCSATSVPQSYKFNGKERDAESGLDNFGARYDASSLGRFMTPDWSAAPLTVPGASLDDPQSLNLYSYVGNNPLTYIDPDGHCWKLFGWACNTYQRFANWADGEGFRTNKQIDNTSAKNDPRSQRRRLQEIKGTVSSQLDRTLHGGNALGPGGRDEIRAFCGGNPVCYDIHSHFGWVGAFGNDRWATFAGTYLYEKVGPNGEHLKYGITDHPETRYTAKEMNGGRLKILAEGERGKMLELERSLHETMPIGPEEGQSGYIDIQVEKGYAPPPYDVSPE